MSSKRICCPINENREIEGLFSLMQDDSNTCVITFVLDKAPNGVDLTGYDFYIAYKKENSQVNYVQLERYVYEKSIELVWIPNSEATASIGKVKYQIYCLRGSNRWSTEVGQMVIKPSINIEEC